MNPEEEDDILPEYDFGNALESSMFALGQTEQIPEDSGQPELDAALAQARTWMAHARELQLLSLYESRIRRLVEKNTAELRKVQARRQTTVALEPDHFLTALFKAGNDDPAGDVPAETPDSSIRFFEDPDPASDQPEPEEFTEKSTAPPPEPATQPGRPATRPSQEQRTANALCALTKDPPPTNSPETGVLERQPEPTRQPTMEDVYDIIGRYPRR